MYIFSNSDLLSLLFTRPGNKNMTEITAISIKYFHFAINVKKLFDK